MNELTDLKTQVSSFQKEMAESALMLSSMGPVTAVVKCQMSQVVDDVTGLKSQISNFRQDMLKETAGSVMRATANRAEFMKCPKDLPEADLKHESRWRSRHKNRELNPVSSSPMVPELMHRPTSMKQLQLQPDKLSDSEDLIELLRCAYEEPLPLNLPNLQGPERLFADQCQRVEVQLGRLVDILPAQKAAPQLELFTCSARLLATVSRALPKMLPPPPCNKQQSMNTSLPSSLPSTNWLKRHSRSSDIRCIMSGSDKEQESCANRRNNAGCIAANATVMPKVHVDIVSQAAQPLSVSSRATLI